MTIIELENGGHHLTATRDPDGRLLISLGPIGNRLAIFLDIAQEEQLLDALLSSKMDQLGKERPE